MCWSPFFWALGGVCNTLRQLGMVFLSWKEVCGDGWHPFKFCYPPLGALFQTRYPVGSNQTGSSFLPHCQRKLSKSFHSPEFADKDKKDKLLVSTTELYSFRIIMKNFTFRLIVTILTSVLSFQNVWKLVQHSFRNCVLTKKKCVFFIIYFVRKVTTLPVIFNYW